MRAPWVERPAHPVRSPKPTHRPRYLLCNPVLCARFVSAVPARLNGLPDMPCHERAGRAKQLRQQSRLLLDALQGVNPIESPLCSTTPTALAASSRSKSSNFASVPPRPSNTPTFGDELTQRLDATQRKFRTKVAWQLDEAAGSAPSVPAARPPGLMRRTSSHLLNMLASVSS